MNVSEVFSLLESFCTDRCEAGESFAPNFAEFFLRHIDAPFGLTENVISKLVELGHCHSNRKTMFVRPAADKGLALNPISGQPIP